MAEVTAERYAGALKDYIPTERLSHDDGVKADNFAEVFNKPGLIEYFEHYTGKKLTPKDKKITKRQLADIIGMDPESSLDEAEQRIITGEAKPLDKYVMVQQPTGWNPDENDGHKNHFERLTKLKALEAQGQQLSEDFAERKRREEEELLAESSGDEDFTDAPTEFSINEIAEGLEENVQEALILAQEVDDDLDRKLTSKEVKEVLKSTEKHILGHPTDFDSGDMEELVRTASNLFGEQDAVTQSMRTSTAIIKADETGHQELAVVTSDEEGSEPGDPPPQTPTLKSVVERVRAGLTQRRSSHSVDNHQGLKNMTQERIEERQRNLAQEEMTPEQRRIQAAVNAEFVANMKTVSHQLNRVGFDLSGRNSLLQPDKGRRDSAQFGRETGEELEKLDTFARLYPRTAKLYAKGQIKLIDFMDKEFAEASEATLKRKEERTGTLQQRQTRKSVGPASYVRTTARPGGVYKYRRPHFTTSPYFKAAASAR